MQKQIIIADSDGTAKKQQPCIEYAPEEKYGLCRCDQSKKDFL